MALPHAPRGLGREIEEGAERAAGALPSTQFQHLSEQHEHGDDRGRFEIDRHAAVGAAEALGKHGRQEGRDHAIEIGRTGAERDQREHVEIAARDRCPAALKEGKARPKHDRRRQRELDPAGKRRRNQMVQPQPGHMLAHLEDDDRQRQHEPDPEAPLHVDELRIGFVGVRHQRLERHAAYRATSRAFLSDLRMHRAGVNRAGRTGGRRGLHGSATLLQIRIGICDELRAAAGGAEMISGAVMLVAMTRARRVHIHAADRIQHLGRRSRGVAMILMMFVVAIVQHSIAPIDLAAGSGIRVPASHVGRSSRIFPEGSSRNPEIAMGYFRTSCGRHLTERSGFR